MTFFEDYAHSFQTIQIRDSPLAEILKGIDNPPDELYVCSNNLDDLLTRKRVAIVGTRKITPYGKMVTRQFAGDLAGQGIAIVSGLAFGVDAAAHQACLDAGGVTIAVLPSSLSRVYPSAHIALARRIIEQGGALISEYPVGSDIAYKNQFVERNRIVAGLSDILLITEAAIDSGTMHTARFAIEQGKTVMAVPGNVASPYSEGTNTLLLDPRAAPAIRPDNILQALGMSRLGDRPPVRARSADEQVLVNLIAHNVRTGEHLLEASQLDVSSYNKALTMLELTGRIYALGNNQWALR